MPPNLTDEKSIMIQATIWGRQATSNYRSQCWPISVSLYVATGPQCVKIRPQRTWQIGCWRRRRLMLSAWNSVGLVRWWYPVYTNIYHALICNDNQVAKAWINAGLLGYRVIDIINLRLINSPTPQCRMYASVNRISIGSDNGLSPIRRQAIIWTSAGLLSIRSSDNA